MTAQGIAQNLAMGKRGVIGALCWWTIRKGVFDVPTTLQEATAAGLDGYVLDRILGRDAKSSFIKATQTGARGIPVPSSPTTQTRLITREASADGDPGSIRALMYQETDIGASFTEDIVTGKTAATVSFTARNGGDILVEYASWADGDSRIVDVVEKMRENMRGMIGTIDDSKVRSIVIGWLKMRHRVTVRGTGGVYFIPAGSRKADREKLQKELMAMRTWLATMGSPFSIVAMTETTALSIDDFVADAIGEIESELKSVAERMDKWEQNAGMNAGSRMFSSRTQVERLAGLESKIGVLKQSLGGRIGVVDQMFKLLQIRTGAMFSDNSIKVEEAKTKREAEKAEKAAKAAAKAQAKERDGKNKKAGTASKRGKKRVV